MRTLTTHRTHLRRRHKTPQHNHTRATNQPRLHTTKNTIMHLTRTTSTRFPRHPRPQVLILHEHDLIQQQIMNDLIRSIITTTRQTLVLTAQQPASPLIIVRSLHLPSKRSLQVLKAISFSNYRANLPTITHRDTRTHAHVNTDDSPRNKTIPNDLIILIKIASHEQVIPIRSINQMSASELRALGHLIETVNPEPARDVLHAHERQLVAVLCSLERVGRPVLFEFD